MNWIVQTRAKNGRNWKTDGVKYASDMAALSSLCGKERAYRTQIYNLATGESWPV